MKIEKTFIVSLPNRLFDRLIPLIDYVKEIDLDYFVVSAIKKDNGKVGLIKTVYKLFSDCIDLGLRNILVLEDDCRFLINPIETINKCFEQLPEDYDMLYLSCNLWQNHVYKYSENLIQLEDAYTTHCVIYSESGIRKVLEAINENNDLLPLDVLIKEKIMPDKKCFCSFPILAKQMDSFSDIENKEVKYSRFIEDRFEEKTKHLKNNLEV